MIFEGKKVREGYKFPEESGIGNDCYPFCIRVGGYSELTDTRDAAKTMDKFLTLVQKLVGDVDLDRELAQIEAKQFLTPQAKRRIRKWKKQLSPDCSFLLIRDSDLIPGVNLAICYDAYLWRRDCFSALAYPKEEKSVRATQAYERLKSCGVSKLEQLAADWLEEAESHKEETMEQV